MPDNRDRREYQKQYRAKNAVAIKAQRAGKYLQTRDSAIAKAKEWAVANRDKTRASVKKWTVKNRGKVNAIAAAYMRENPERNCAKAAKARAARLNATPAWANGFFIKEIYHLAKLRAKIFGGKWHVDHIVPLRSKIVCGLHCEANLQILPAASNLQKSNCYWPDMP